MPPTPDDLKYFLAVEDAAAKSGVDPDLIHRMVNTESSGSATAVSPKGAQGLMQLMPATAKEMGVTDPNDPIQNINGGVKYYKQNLDRFGGDTDKALAAYNAGPGRVMSGQPLPTETQNYVQKIHPSAGGASADDLKQFLATEGHQPATGQQKDFTDKALDWLPTIGGAIGGIGAGLLGIESGPGAIATGMAGAAAGGAAGESARHFIERYVRGKQTDEYSPISEGAKQGAYEAVGGLAAKPIQAVAGGLYRSLDPAVVKIGRSLGLSLPEMGGGVGKIIQDSADATLLGSMTAKKAADKTAEALPLFLQSTGQDVAHSVNTAGDLFKQEASRRYGGLSPVMKQTPVDLTPVAKFLLDQEKLGIAPPPILSELMSNATAENARVLRSQLLQQIGYNNPNFGGGMARGVRKQASSLLDDAIMQGLTDAGHASTASDYRAAQDFYRQGAGLFDKTFASRVGAGKVLPENVLAATTKPTNADQLDAVWNFAKGLDPNFAHPDLAPVHTAVGMAKGDIASGVSIPQKLQKILELGGLAISPHAVAATEVGGGIGSKLLRNGWINDKLYSGLLGKPLPNVVAKGVPANIARLLGLAAQSQ